MNYRHFADLDVSCALQVDSLAGIAAATDGEVSLQHLGSRFAAASGDYILQGIASPATSSPSYDMPNF